MKTAFIESAATVCLSKWTFLFQGALLSISYILLYGRLVPGLVSDWSSSTYSYGFLVPAIAGYLAWQKRSRIKRLAVSPALWGNVALLFAVVLLLVGQVIADSFVMRVSMVLALAALIQASLGTCILKELGFPLFYLALMIPVPFVVVDKIVNYLMFFDARHAASILQLIGVPVYLESNFLHLPNITLEVAKTCSGIKSIFALFVLGVFYSALVPLPFKLRALLAASTVPLAVVANLFRIIVTVGLTYYIGPAVLDSVIHQFHGTFNFLLSFLLLIALAEALRKKSAPVTASPHDFNRLRGAIHGTGLRSTMRWHATALSTLVLVMAILLAGVLEKPYNGSKSIDLAKMPSSSGSFTPAAEPWPDAYQDTKAEQAVTRFYANAAGTPIELFVGHKGGSRDGDRLQSPKLILPSKWSYVWVKPIQLPIDSAGNIEANWMLTYNAGARRLVLYWYQSGAGETFAGEFYYRFALLKARILNGGSGLAVIRIATPILQDEEMERAENRIMRFVAEVYPQLLEMFPRQESSASP